MAQDGWCTVGKKGEAGNKQQQPKQAADTAADGEKSKLAKKRARQRERAAAAATEAGEDAAGATAAPAAAPAATAASTATAAAAAQPRAEEVSPPAVAADAPAAEAATPVAQSPQPADPDTASPPLSKSAQKRARQRAQKDAPGATAAGANGSASSAAASPAASASTPSVASPPALPAPAVKTPSASPTARAAVSVSPGTTSASPAGSAAGDTAAAAPYVFELNTKPTGYQLRGMVNLGNTCYQNAVMHALVASPPFLNLVKALPKTVKSPVLREVRAVVHGFRPGPQTAPIDARQLLSVMATQFKPAARGSQEDAGEYLINLLSRAEEEMNVLCGLKEADGAGKKKKQKKAADDGWETATKSGKSHGVEHTTGAVVEKSPINTIFGGLLSSRLASMNTKASVTNQPFTGPLPVDIINDKCASVEACLQDFTAPQHVDNLTTGTGATKQIRFTRLPPMLILQLNRWYAADKTSKRLFINPTLVIHPSSTADRRRYEYTLVAAVCHMGATKDSGHYTAVVRKNGKWALADDTRIVEIPSIDAAAADPYLLFYAKTSCK